MADAFSTGLFVLGVQESLEVLQGLPGTDALFIPDKVPLEFWLTAGMRKLFIPQSDLEDSVRILKAPSRER